MTRGNLFHKGQTCPTSSDLPVFRLNAPVVISHLLPYDNWSIQSKRRQVIFQTKDNFSLNLCSSQLRSHWKFVISCTACSIILVFTNWKLQNRKYQWCSLVNIKFMPSFYILYTTCTRMSGGMQQFKGLESKWDSPTVYQHGKLVAI